MANIIQIFENTQDNNKETAILKMIFSSKRNKETHELTDKVLLRLILIILFINYVARSHDWNEIQKCFPSPWTLAGESQIFCLILLYFLYISMPPYTSNGMLKSILY